MISCKALLFLLRHIPENHKQLVIPCTLVLNSCLRRSIIPTKLTEGANSGSTFYYGGVTLRKFMLLATTLLTVQVMATSPFLANFEKKDVDIKSMGTLAFGPEGILLVGDSIGASIYAFDLGDRTPAKLEEPQRIADLEEQLGSLLGAPAADVLVHSMAVNPISMNTYFSVSRGRANWKSAWELPNDISNADILVKLTPAGVFSEVSIKALSHSKVDLPNPISTEAKHEWKQTSPRSDVISDMNYQKGRLFVAGLSNEEFSSTLRILDFPFKGSGNATGVEIYHGAHGKYETKSPVRAFLPYVADGKDHILAAYLCTPLAVFDVDELLAGKKVRGRTVAELGSGNFPTGMVRFSKEGKDYVLVSHSNRNLMVFDMDRVVSWKEEITEKQTKPTGLLGTPISGTGIRMMDSLSNDFIQMIARSPNGKLELFAYPTRRLAR